MELSNELRVEEGLRMDELGRGEAMVDIAQWFLTTLRAMPQVLRGVRSHRSSVLSRDRRWKQLPTSSTRRVFPNF